MPIGRFPNSSVMSPRIMAFGNPFFVARYISAPRLEALVNVDFGFVDLGTSVTKSLLLRNRKLTPVTITGFSIGGAQAYTVDSPSAPYTIPAGDTGIVRIRFQPTNTLTANGMLTVHDDEPVVPPSVFL